MIMNEPEVDPPGADVEAELLPEDEDRPSGGAREVRRVPASADREEHLEARACVPFPVPIAVH